MAKLTRQSCILAITLILVCIIARICTGNTYTGYVPMNNIYQDTEELHVVHTGENGSINFGQPQPGQNYFKIQAQPDRPGMVEASIQTDQGEDVAMIVYHVGRFGTIYDMNTGGFTGDTIVMIALTVFFLAESLLMFLAYRRAKGPSFYAYSTIHTAGFSLFLFLTGLLLLISTVRHLLDPGNFPMLGIYGMVSSAGYNFMLITSPLILVFSTAMTVSNIELLRHERPRFQNILGILISLMMIGGVVLAVILFGSYFSGSEQEYHIFKTAQNVYCTAYAYFECMLIGAVICGITAARHIPSGVFDYIIILGCGFRKDGTLPPLLRGRVDRAISFWKEQRKKFGKTAVLVPSGGQGPNEVMAEAEAMRNYLVSHNIPEECILPENRSRNTYQNMEFSKNLIEKESPEARVVFSTTNYHVFRSGIWASLAGLKAEGIGSNTKWWFWPNAFMRECVGLLANRWKNEILLLVILTVLFGTMSMIL